MIQKKTEEKKCWCIRAGKGGEAHDLFLDCLVIALADAQMGDLSKLGASRDSFYDLYRMKHPDDSKTGSAGIAGKFFRFAYEVQIGDLVIYPSLIDKSVYVGDVSGSYTYCDSSPFPHRRAMKWNFVIPRSDLSRTAMYELGAARTFFEFSKNLEELKQKIANPKVIQFSAARKMGKKGGRD